MQEFLTPRLQEMGDEREMLVDEEYELYQDCLQSMELYHSPQIQEAAPVSSVKKLYYGNQWLHDSEPPEPQEARSMMSMYSQETLQYGYNTENMVRDQNRCPTSPLCLPSLSQALSHVTFKETKFSGSFHN